MTQTATSPQRKPELDEASFQQLLTAAYVLQEHNDRLRAKGVQADFAENLSGIVETQKLIQTLQLDLSAAAELVAERIQKITNASGTAIGVLEKGQVFYRATTGSAAADAGTRHSLDSALSGECLSKGTALNYPDVTSNLHVRADLFRNSGVKAFIAVPVYHAGRVAGVLELRFAKANSFREADLRTAELMAGLLSEAMVTASRMKWKEALASERQSMLEALERIKPQIERLGSDSSSMYEADANPLTFSAQPAAKIEFSGVRGADTCPACGTDFFDEGESFCGTCGTARPLVRLAVDSPRMDATNREAARIDTTKKADPPWLVPYGQESPGNGNSALNSPFAGEPFAAEKTPVPTGAAAADLHTASLHSPSQKLTEPLSAAPTDFRSNPGLAADSAGVASAYPHDLPQLIAGASSESLRIIPVDTPANDPMAPTGEIQPYPWGSAKKAQHWLEEVKTQRGPRAEWLAQQWQRRRANIYVVIAAVILLLVISGWGIRPAGTTAAVNASPAHAAPEQASSKPPLTMFEQLMVSLGLAEPPPAPVYMGNPETQVWVDVHTALYYCPDSELYGKTADGKFAPQRDAQQDQFEPANRRACP